MENDTEKLARIEDILHKGQRHPDYEYDSTDGPRKAWYESDRPPEGGGWIRNTHKADNGWERFDYHEESYWMRPKASV